MFRNGKLFLVLKSRGWWLIVKPMVRYHGPVCLYHSLVWTQAAASGGPLLLLPHHRGA